jgi:hypothetical protein
MLDSHEHERLSNITRRHKLKEQFVVRKDMDVNEHERLSNITLRHKLKKQFAVRKDMDIVSRVHLHPYPFLLQAVSLTCV